MILKVVDKVFCGPGIERMFLDELGFGSGDVTVGSNYSNALPQAGLAAAVAAVPNADIAGVINEAHFYDPVHARIYEIAASRIAKNALASPVTLKAFLEDDEGLKELGGPAYLARLAGADHM